MSNLDLNKENHKSNITDVERVFITLHSTPNYRSYIEISTKNVNYNQLCYLNNLLRRNNLKWKWLIANCGIDMRVFNQYCAGIEPISLSSIIKISHLLKDYIKNPKELMNRDIPTLKGNNDFRLNFKDILDKYNISKSELIHYTYIDKGSYSRIMRGLQSQLHFDSLKSVFDFFKYKGVPLDSILDLIYFPGWGEYPLSFIKKKPYEKRMIFKYNSYIRESSLNKL